MSLRVDLYPIALPRLVALFGADGWSHALPLVDGMRAEGQERLDDALLDDLFTGKFRASRLEAEDGALAALVAALAYRLRETRIESLFDVGGLWNAIEQVAAAGLPLPGEEQTLIDALVRGRPLLGLSIRTDWNSYTWISTTELDAFDSLIRRVEELAPYDVGRVRPWLDQLRSKQLGVFVAIG